MKFAIDGSTLVGAKTGIDYMTEGLVNGFKQFPKHDLFVYTTQHYQRSEGVISGASVKFVVITKPTGFAAGLRWYWRATRDMRAKKIDVFISTVTFTASLMFPQTIQIVPDISPLALPYMFDFKHRVLFRITLRLAINYAWRVATISGAVAQEIKSRFPRYKKQVGVVPLSINDWAKAEKSSPQDVEKLVRKYQLPAKYFLSISTLQPRKNYENMLIAFAKFSEQNPDFHYIIIGKKGWRYKKIFELLEELNLKRRVQILDYVPDEDLSGILDASSGLLYASLYEGFGIPPLNAAYRGVPALVSDLPVFHETLSSEFAIFVNPHDVEGITRGIKDLVNMRFQDRNEGLILRYNWERAAETVIEMAAL